MSAVVLKNREEIELMRESALIVSKTLGMLAGEVKPGVSSLELDAKAEEFIRDHGAVTQPIRNAWRCFFAVAFAGCRSVHR